MWYTGQRGARGYKELCVSSSFLLQNSFYIQQPQMDSFTYIALADVPANNDDGGSGGNAYCVVAHSTPVDAPTNMDDGGSGGNAYCIVA